MSAVLGPHDGHLVGHDHAADRLACLIEHTADRAGKGFIVFDEQHPQGVAASNKF